MPVDDVTSDVPDDVVQEIRRLLSRELGSAGIRESDVDVRSGEDHDGDPAIMVRIRHRPSRRPFDALAAAGASLRLNTMLHERGERRFAYVMHDDEADA